MEIIFKDLGIIDYLDAFKYQEDLFNEAINKKIETGKVDKNYILFCEHPHVYTLGRFGSEKNMLIDYIQLSAKNAKFYHTNRGGDITYHGYGQIVCYPIIDLEAFGIGVKKYVHILEESIIMTLKHYNILAGRLHGATGVWLDPDVAGKQRKICAIGIKVSRGITMHGLAFNINTDLSYFNYINPCGYTDKGVTSLQKELNREINIDEVKEIVKESLMKLLINDSYKNKQN